MKKRGIAFLLTVLMLLTLMPLSAGAADFVDVPAKAFYAKAVAWAVENEITKGKDATHFDPGGICTRGEVVTFLWRSVGSPEPATTRTAFTDLKPGAYYYKAVLWAVENGVTTGTSKTTFEPKAPCTRGHVVTFLHRAEYTPPVGGDNPFPDVPNGKYYTSAVLWAVANNITKGKDGGLFKPGDPCTRGEIVTFLHRDSQLDEEMILLPKQTRVFSETGEGDEDVTTYTYDAVGNNIRLEHDGGIVETAEYNALGDMLKRMYIAGEDERTAVYTLDANGRPVRESAKWNFSPVEQITEKTYDENGRLIQEKISGINEGDEYLYYTYDADGRETSFTYEHETATTYERNVSTYTYNTYGDIVMTVEDYNWTENGETSTEHYVFEALNHYDSAGRVIDSAEYWNGKLQYTTTYTYDSEGNVSHRTFRTDDYAWTIDYTYANGGVCTSSVKAYEGGGRFITIYTYQAFPVSKLPQHWMEPMEPDIYA